MAFLRKRRKQMKLLFGCLVMALLAGTPATAAIVSFTCLSDNSGQCPALAPQITIDATNPGSNRLSLELTNSGPIPSSVTAVYFDFAGMLFTGFFSSIGSGPGVVFPIDGSVTPGNVPGGNNATPAFSSDLGIDTAPPTSPNGVGPGEGLTLLLNIGGGSDIGNVVDQFINGNLRIALHVQSIGTSGGSDALISNPLPPGTPRNLQEIPEPAYGLLIGGLLVLFGLARSGRRKQENIA